MEAEGPCLPSLPLTSASKEDILTAAAPPGAVASETGALRAPLLLLPPDRAVSHGLRLKARRQLQQPPLELELAVGAEPVAIRGLSAPQSAGEHPQTYRPEGTAPQL